MGLIEKLFPSKTTVTSALIRAEIKRAEGEITTLRAKLDTAESEIATLDDAAHVKVIESNAAIRRSIARIEARIAHLDTELPAVIAAEEADRLAAATDAVRARAEAARKENSKEAKALLADYDVAAEKIANILIRLAAIDSERDAVNEALRANPIAEPVVGYSENYRKHPDREASERREMRPVWVHGNGKVEVAHLDQLGNPIKADRIWNHMKQGYEDVNFEQREVVVGQTYFRPGHYELPLSAIILPAGFSGGVSHWPRR